MTQDISVVGLDIAKRIFHLVGTDDRGKVILRKGIVKLLRLKPSSSTRGPLSRPLSPLCRPFRARHFSPTRESSRHLVTVRRRRQQMPTRSEVLGYGSICRQKALGMTGRLKRLPSSTVTKLHSSK